MVLGYVLGVAKVKKIYRILLSFFFCIVLLLFVKAVAWDISTGVYTNKFFNVSSQSLRIQDVQFNGSGDKMFTIDATTQQIYAHTLSIPWDVSTATYDNENLTLFPNNPSGFFFNSSGMGLVYTEYIAGAPSPAFQYSCTTPWNISTCNNIINTTLPSCGFAQDIISNDNMSRIYCLDFQQDMIFQYSLSDINNISTRTYDNVNLSVGIGSSIADGFWKSDGTSFYFTNISSSPYPITQYECSSPYNISSCSYSKNITTTYDPGGIYIHPSGKYFYISSEGVEAVFQFDLTSCTPVNETSWVITDGDNCTITDGYNLGNNPMRIMNGSVKITNTGFIISQGCYIADTQRLFVQDGGKLICR
jgi:hypothetical protein